MPSEQRIEKYAQIISPNSNTPGLFVSIRRLIKQKIAAARQRYTRYKNRKLEEKFAREVFLNGDKKVMKIASVCEDIDGSTGGWYGMPRTRVDPEINNPTKVCKVEYNELSAKIGDEKLTRLIFPAKIEYCDGSMSETNIRNSLESRKILEMFWKKHQKENVVVDTEKPYISDEQERMLESRTFRAQDVSDKHEQAISDQSTDRTS